MIALPQRLPHVIWKNDRLVPLSEGWLAESIEHAAEAAGHHRWHLAPEVARAIAVYLENDWIAPALKVDHLREMVQRSLEGIGYDDIARQSLIVPPRVSISLMELAVRALRDRILPAPQGTPRRRARGPGRRRPPRGPARLHQSPRRRRPLAPRLHAHQ
jgi:hypothetical protein